MNAPRTLLAGDRFVLDRLLAAHLAAAGPPCADPDVPDRRKDRR